jgi:hypothetical protein
MRIYALLVNKNEGGRYLDSWMAWHKPMFDEVVVYDDSSTDNSEDIVTRRGGIFVPRPDDVPTFMEHEGHFRQASLEALEKEVGLEDGDWIFGIDADEFLVGPAVGHQQKWIGRYLRAQALESWSKVAVRVRRPELWRLHPPMERIDGYWGSIVCTRFFKWRPGGQIAEKAMGCGSEPTYVATGPVDARPISVELVHIGYVHPDDRFDKYERYTSLNDHGHNDAHIKSIIGAPDLREYKYELPSIWRGA